jgi:nitrite reductase/ring-hydroxylating ferredoxin subunit
VFNVDTGEPESLPATSPVPTYPLTIDDDEIKVEI